MRLGFGKYKDTDLRDVPEEYLQWLINSSLENVNNYQAELARREMVEEADASWTERIIKIGYRELAKRHHPDGGGSDADMQQLNNAYENLKGRL
jgi:hypothetical protein